MTKLTTPVLSLAARGTLGDAITFQRAKHLTHARTKPTPTQPYTLPQAYRRWLYQDYIALWNSLTTAQKSAYRTRASQSHSTPLSEFMRYYLTRQPDLRGVWRFDTDTPGTLLDFSKNTNNGTITGCTPVKGLIAQGLSFDGIDDRIVVPHHASLDITGTAFSLITRFYVPTGGRTDIYKWNTDWATFFHGFRAIVVATGHIYFTLGFGATWKQQAAPANSFPRDEWATLTLTYDGAFMRTFVNETEVGAPLAAAADMVPATTLLYIGHETALGVKRLDHTTLLSRTLSPAMIAQQSERRYP